MRTVKRFEYKYLISRQQYHQIKNAALIYMDMDKFTLRSEDQKYLVKSLYFDTNDYEAYTDKCYGNYSRIKLRIRSYHENFSNDTPISVELKTRKGLNMTKYSVFVKGRDYLEYIRTGHWPNHNNEVLTEFERLAHLKALRPKTLVRYKREGLQPKDREDFRLTFDHTVESASADRLFPEKPLYKGHDHHKGIILEIKTLDIIPPWLQRIIQQYGLKAMSNSKYGQSIELTRKDVVMPMSDHMLSSFYTMKGRQ
ncbi:VTC domain-containing protein [Pelagirhabdus alkalitolerans]|uniref:VTC domain-containing protein n=1 Tax=Pelagirhabdus alkalitolerans TaxID=1612202 RepID=A0A1G6GGK9_9BACI|nr:polyphosphate polymerase domain-containing protein [Pelagirhabdus alkalitolerans]SDB81141.1 VTC domain-containing protein [Pelagirhabdus alkalitolerans]